MKTIPLRNFDGGMTSSKLIIAALENPGPGGVTFREVARRLPIIEKIKAAESQEKIDLEDAEFETVRQLFENCAFTAVLPAIGSVGADLAAAAG